MAYQSINPNDGSAPKTFEDLTDQELETKVAGAATLVRVPQSTPAV